MKELQKLGLIKSVEESKNPEIIKQLKQLQTK
jgi:hypothetical protein